MIGMLMDGLMDVAIVTITLLMLCITSALWLFAYMRSGNGYRLAVVWFFGLQSAAAGVSLVVAYVLADFRAGLLVGRALLLASYVVALHGCLSLARKSREG